MIVRGSNLCATPFLIINFTELVLITHAMEIPRQNHVGAFMGHHGQQQCDSDSLNASQSRTTLVFGRAQIQRLQIL